MSLVLAHEWGHAVQRRGSVDQTLPTVVRELQADCFAGAWAGDATGENGRIRVGPTELDTATAGYLLFRDPTGTSARASGAHGVFEIYPHCNDARASYLTSALEPI